MIDNIFTFAENFNLSIHKICLDSLHRHNKNAKVFTKESIKELPGGEEFCDKYKSLSLLHFSDVFRVWYILNFGGFWIDADCLHLKQLDFPYEMHDENVAFIYDDVEKITVNQCLIYSKLPDNEFLKKYYERQTKLIEDKGNNLPYLDLGQWSIHHLLIHDTFKMNPVIVPHWRYNYIVWFDKSCFMQQRDWCDFENDKQIYNSDAYCYHLNNVTCSYVKDLSYDDILAGKTFLSFLVAKALA